jgi:hypothetical protein
MGESEISEFISSEVTKYVERKLGGAAGHITVTVSYTSGGVEVDVDVYASALVDDAYLQRVADGAAELGICIADLIRERGWPVSRDEIKESCLRD